MPIAPEYLHLVQRGPFPCYLYGRNSRDPKSGSVAAQLNDGRALATKHGWPVVDEFKDPGISATRYARKTRDDFAKMIAGIRAGYVRIVVAFEASRLYRDLEAYVALRNACMDAGVLLCYQGQVYDLSKPADRKATAQDAIEAEAEGDSIRDRTLRTVRELAAAGKPAGRLLDGYKRRYDPDTGQLVEQYVDPERGPIILDIWLRAAARQSRRSIVLGLAASGIRTKNGLPFTEHRVATILRNPAYAGLRVHQGKVIREATWPALVPMDVYETVQQINAESDGAYVYQHDGQPRRLMVRLALCGFHEDRPTAELPVLVNLVGRSKASSYKCEETAHVRINEKLLDAAVEEAVVTWLSRPEAAAAFENEEDRTRVDAAQARLEGLVRQLARAREMAAEFGPTGEPRLSVDALVGMEARLLPQIKQAREDAAARRLPADVADLAGNPDAAAVWDDLTMTSKRAVVREVVTVKVFPARAKGVRKLEPGRISLAFRGEPGWVSPAAIAAARAGVLPGPALRLLRESAEAGRGEEPVPEQ
ncbi:recombinase family protein [Streptomyces bambusae]|uniref:recombinase family protein n=1 Tax=Streptomyces bambusae TaxID=1550616 RepID=UPI001CFF03E8|nr:recombinase family protein [Streptomyces bambusae]MCB5168060.1 recombinase family protein [Streptomyces bambusae]